MISDHEKDINIQNMIYEQFPQFPMVTRSKAGFLNSIAYNLSQIKDESQIGTDSYDMYAYAMIYSLLETHFYQVI